MNELTQKIIRLRDVEGLSNSLIAERLGLTTVNVAQRYKRGKNGNSRNQKTGTQGTNHNVGG
jgi:DNA-directed RNA polymerase specialized sigma24 family protein